MATTLQSVIFSLSISLLLRQMCCRLHEKHRHKRVRGHQWMRHWRGELWHQQSSVFELNRFIQMLGHLEQREDQQLRRGIQISSENRPVCWYVQFSLACHEAKELFCCSKFSLIWSDKLLLSFFQSAHFLLFYLFFVLLFSRTTNAVIQFRQTSMNARRDRMIVIGKHNYV